MIDFSRVLLQEVADAATMDDATNTESVTGFVLPHSYKKLLGIANGFYTSDGVIIYGLDELKERNETHETAFYAPGCIAIGDDSGGYVLIMRQIVDSTSLFKVDVGDMTEQSFQLVSNDFTQWVINGCLLMKGD